MNILQAFPNDDWELPMLAEFCIRVLRRTAEDVWKLGKALAIARTKLKGERRWVEWLKNEVKGLGKSTAYRYIEVHQRCSLDQIGGLQLNEVYALIQAEKETANAVKRGAKQPQRQVSRKKKSATPSTPTASETQFIWAVPELDDFDHVLDEIDSLILMLQDVHLGELDDKKREAFAGRIEQIRIILHNLDQGI